MGYALAKEIFSHVTTAVDIDTARKDLDLYRYKGREVPPTLTPEKYMQMINDEVQRRNTR